MANYFDEIITLDSEPIPLRVYVERRPNVRASLGKDFVILRIPIFESSNLEKHVTYTKNWLMRIKQEKPLALLKYSVEKYEENFSITILEKFTYHIVVHEENSSKCTIKHNSKLNTITITLANDLLPHERKVAIRTLMSRLFAKRYKSYVWERLQYWNDLYFHKSINNLTMKYNATNWGSCSTKKNINISTRCLLLPHSVFDYILVHELSHLVEMNHSSRFWKVVEDIIPDYKNAEAWITKHGPGLDF